MASSRLLSWLGRASHGAGSLPIGDNPTGCGSSDGEYASWHGLTANCFLRLVASPASLLNELQLSGSPRRNPSLPKDAETVSLTGTWSGSSVAVHFLLAPQLSHQVQAGMATLLNQSLSHPYLLQYYFASALQVSPQLLQRADELSSTTDVTGPFARCTTSTLEACELSPFTPSWSDPGVPSTGSQAREDRRTASSSTLHSDVDLECTSSVNACDSAEALLAGLTPDWAIDSVDTAAPDAVAENELAVSQLLPVLQALQPRAGHYLVMVVSEHCCLGDLRAALGAVCFAPNASSSSPYSGLRAAVRTAREVALGLGHLHSLGHAHGRLSAENVLLADAPTDRRGFTVKLADATLASLTHGSAAHPVRQMAAMYDDVYAFGLLLYDLLAAATAKSTTGAACAAPSMAAAPGGGGPLEQVAKELACLRVLQQRCVSRDAAGRPSAARIAAELGALHERLLWYRGCAAGSSNSPRPGV